MKRIFIIIVIMILTQTADMINASGQSVGYEFSSVACGYFHSVGIRSDGSVWTWGNNSFGQLGNGTTQNSIMPTQINNLSNVISIAGGYDHSIALEKDGSVWTWGNNTYGQLGDGTTQNKTKPIKIQELTGIISIACGNDYSLAIDDDGTVWAWGANWYGQLGDGTTESRTKPVQVKDLNNVISVACGDNHSMALKNDGTVWTWGANITGQLGDGTIENKLIPMKAQGLTNIKQVACGNSYSMALQSNNTVWAWGTNGNGQYANGTTKSEIIPVKINNLKNVKSIACGDSQTLILRNDGTVLVSGGGTPLGDGTTIANKSPVKLNILDNISAVYAKYQSNMALQEDGTVWVWGNNNEGQLGDGTHKDIYSPVSLSPDADNKQFNQRVVQIRLNGKQLMFTELKLDKKRLLVSAKELCQTLDLKMQFNPKTKLITIIKGNKKIELGIDSFVIIKDNRPFNTEVSAKMIHNQVYVPLRIIAEYFNASVVWDSRNNCANIYYNIKYVNDTVKILENHEMIKDELFDKQWGFYNDGEDIGQIKGIKGIDINILPVWKVTTGSESSVVGVADTGIDINHIELEDRIYINPYEIAGNGIDDDGNGYIDDTNGWDFLNNDNTVYDSPSIDKHGTAVAGVIAASQNNTGIIGVAPSVKVLPLKILSEYNGSITNILRAINYAKQMNISIINCSWGQTNYDYMLEETMKNTNILFVCAAGNKSPVAKETPFYPASYDLPNILSVAAIQNNGELLESSNYGGSIHLAAPGLNILSTSPENSYDYFHGTSIATPFVTGACVLIKSYDNDMTPNEISNRIKSTVRFVQSVKGKITTDGILDTSAAIYNIQ